MTSKRIKAIASTKKRDHMTLGQHPPGTIEGAPSEYINQVMDGEDAMYLFSPSFMPMAHTQTAYGRYANRVHHTSFAERFEITIGCDVSLTHRRIVFSNNYEDQRAVCVQTDTGSVPNKITTRNMTKVNQNDFWDLFQGTRTVDWWDIMRAKTDRKKITVMSDKLRTYTPKSVHGQAYNPKFYTKINKWYDFPDREAGGEDAIGSAWPGIKSPKIFIMDIFRSFKDTRDTTLFPKGEQYWALSTEATNYWTEP